MADGEVTNEGKRLIDRWLEAQRQLDRRRNDVISAECELSNSANALAKWMLPDDAKPGEKIAVWHVDSLVQVEVPQEGCQTEITIRLRGKRGLSAR